MDAARALFNGVWDDPQIVIGSVVRGIFAVFALVVSARSFARTIA